MITDRRRGRQMVANDGKLYLHVTESNHGKSWQIRDKRWQMKANKRQMVTNQLNSDIHVDGCHGSFTYGSKSIYESAGPLETRNLDRRQDFL